MSEPVPHRDSDPCIDASRLGNLGFTRTETVVAAALTEGLTYKEIARRFGVSYHTVHSHVKAIHEKAGVGNNGRLLALIYGR